uniref:Odorant receptor n=2 Tax=Bombyx mori TaxID=7091 RepID=Q0EEF2_BOMMO|nr:candidate olfactory receptor [Bombyx mori]
MSNYVFKPFHETYRIITFTMIAAMIYPNPATEKRRLIYIGLMLLSVIPLAFMIVTEMYEFFMASDLNNTIRHSTVIGPFIGGFVKVALMYYKRRQANELVSEINRDHLAYNGLKGEDREIAASSIRNCQIYCELGWTLIVMSCGLSFPVIAILLNIHSFTFKFDSTKHMIHDINNPFTDDPEDRFESPFFEIMFVYTFFSSFIYIINYVGYDGFFGLCINHACLKMKLYCRALEDAMRSESRRHEKIVAVIEEQRRTYEYIALIQDTFNIWLGLIYVATMIQMCTCMYHIVQSFNIDVRYIIFVISIIHIYLPCRYAANLKCMAAETPTLIYCCGWESVSDLRIKRMMPFMVARSQVIVEITAFNMFAFDMELFVWIMKTSYSMFTLMRS